MCFRNILLFFTLGEREFLVSDDKLAMTFSFLSKALIVFLAP